MIVDLRTYTMAHGRVNAYLTLYEAEGLPVQVRHLGQPIGYFVSEIGTLNQVIHLWGYESLADREQKRAKLAADPDWVAYLKKSAATGNVVRQENQILRSTSFSPI